MNDLTLFGNDTLLNTDYRQYTPSYSYASHFYAHQCRIPVFLGILDIIAAP